MPKYFVLQEVLSLEKGEYFHPGDVLEVVDDKDFGPLVEAQVLKPWKSNLEVQFSVDGIVWVPRDQFVRDPDVRYRIQIVEKPKIKEIVEDAANNQRN